MGATYKDSVRDGSAVTTFGQTSSGPQVRRVPVLMFRLAFEVRRW
jgi:hypothetical protein